MPEKDPREIRIAKVWNPTTKRATWSSGQGLGSNIDWLNLYLKFFYKQGTHATTKMLEAKMLEMLDTDLQSMESKGVIFDLQSMERKGVIQKEGQKDAQNLAKVKDSLNELVQGMIQSRVAIYHYVKVALEKIVAEINSK